MALSILAKATPKLEFIPKDSAIEISLDASISEGHAFNSRVSQFPVEDGSVVADNIINDPTTLDITGFITNTPVTIFLQNAANLVDDTSGGDRVKTAFDALLALRESKEPFTIVTGLKTYENMVFTSLNIPRDKSTGSTNLRFNAKVVNIEFVTSRTEALSKDTVASEPASLSDQATNTKDVGKQTTDEDIGQQSSLLFDVLKDIGLIVQ